MSSLLLNYSRNFIRTSEKLTNLIITRSASRFTIKYKLLKPGEDRIAQGRLTNKGHIDRVQKLVMSSEESNSKENLINSSSDGCGAGEKSSSGDETPSRDDIFEGKIDRFRGVTVHSESEYDLCKNFSEKLQKSLEHWCNNKNRCIWFFVQTAHADWIPELVKAQFEFHHAGKGMAVLYRWLPKDETDNIPEYAHTMIGVGAVILNDKNEILTVSERYTIVANSWKLPGGYVDRNENFVEAAVREVKEETGIDCEFDTVISLRHTHRANFNTSDLYIVMGMKPCTYEYRLDDREIAKIEWMPVDIYLNHPKVHEMNRFFVHKYLNMKKNTTRIRRTEATHSVTKRLVNLYHLQDCLADNDEDRLILQEKKKDNYKNNL